MLITLGGSYCPEQVTVLIGTTIIPDDIKHIRGSRFPTITPTIHCALMSQSVVAEFIGANNLGSTAATQDHTEHQSIERIPSPEARR